MENNSFAAQDALSAIRGTQKALADRLTTPWWYHPALGALVAQFVLVHGLLDQSALKVLSSTALLLGSIGLLNFYKGRTGLSAGWPAGWTPRVLLAGIAVVIAGACLVAVWDNPAPTLVLSAAAAALVGLVVLGPAYDSAYRTELRGRA